MRKKNSREAGKLRNATAAHITDGTGNTLMYGEHAHSEISNLSNPAANGDWFRINW
jgi:hypothetical protein